MAEEKKGIVLETQNGKVTVLSPQGEFISIPWSKLPYPEIGCEISFAESAPQKTWFRISRLAAAAACFLVMLACLSYWTGVFKTSPQQVVAYVNVDINPSIELGINRQGLVLKADGLNQEGELLLQKLELANLGVEQAIELITQAAVESNYLKTGQENNIIITVSNPEKVPDNVKKLEQKVSKQLEASQISGKAQVMEVTGDLHDKAKELGVSPGKYVILLEAVNEGLDLSVEDLKENSISQAIKNAGGIPGQIIAKARHDQKEYRKLEKHVEQQMKLIEESRESGVKLSPGQRKKVDESGKEQEGELEREGKKDNNDDKDQGNKDRNDNGRDNKDRDKKNDNRNKDNAQIDQDKKDDDKDKDKGSRDRDNRNSSRDRNDEDESGSKEDKKTGETGKEGSAGKPGYGRNLKDEKSRDSQTDNKEEPEEADEDENSKEKDLQQERKRVTWPERLRRLWRR